MHATRVARGVEMKHKEQAIKEVQEGDKMCNDKGTQKMHSSESPQVVQEVKCGRKRHMQKPHTLVCGGPQQIKHTDLNEKAFNKFPKQVDTSIIKFISLVYNVIFIFYTIYL